MSRWHSELPQLLILARAALEARGAQTPQDYLLVVGAQEVVSLLVSPSPWTAAERSRLAGIAAERGFETLYPSAPGLITDVAEGRTAPLAAAGLNVCPPTDDSPYFFQVQSPFAPPLDDPALAGLPMNSESTDVLRQLMKRVGLAAAFLFGLPFVLPQIRRALDDGTSALHGSCLLRRHRPLPGVLDGLGLHVVGAVAAGCYAVAWLAMRHHGARCHLQTGGDSGRPGPFVCCGWKDGPRGLYEPAPLTDQLARVLPFGVA